MSIERVYVITGATSGLGLQVVKQLITSTDGRVIVGARDPQSPNLVQLGQTGKVTVHPLDLDSFQSVRSFVEQVKEDVNGSRSVYGIICVAGLQLLGGTEFTADGHERTMQVNVLSHLLCIDELAPVCHPNHSVVTIGSGTHNPDNWLASRFDFTGAHWCEPAQLIQGNYGRTQSNHLQGLDYYATTKLGCIYLAQCFSEEGRKAYCYDPGLMPGTHLARNHNSLIRFAWHYVMPITRFCIKGVSSTKRSATTLIASCIVSPAYESGSYIEYTGDLAPRSETSRDPHLAQDFVRYCRGVISESGV